MSFAAQKQEDPGGQPRGVGSIWTLLIPSTMSPESAAGAHRAAVERAPIDVLLASDDATWIAVAIGAPAPRRPSALAPGRRQAIGRCKRSVRGRQRRIGAKDSGSGRRWAVVGGAVRAVLPAQCETAESDSWRYQADGKSDSPKGVTPLFMTLPIRTTKSEARKREYLRTVAAIRARDSVDR